MDEIHQQRRKALDFDIRERRKHLAGHLDPLAGGEERILGLAIRDPDDHVVEEPCGPAHEVFVTARERVKRPRVDDFEHGHAQPEVVQGRYVSADLAGVATAGRSVRIR